MAHRFQTSSQGAATGLAVFGAHEHDLFGSAGVRLDLSCGDRVGRHSRAKPQRSP